MRKILFTVFLVVATATFIRSRLQKPVLSGHTLVLQNLAPAHLYSQTFLLEQAGWLSIEATGSFENDSVLAAYAWIVSIPSDTVLWAMHPYRIKRRGTLAIARDSVYALPGRYRIYFTTYGDPETPDHLPQTPLKPLARLLNRKNPWTADASRWHVYLKSTHLYVSPDSPTVSKITEDSPFWKATPLGNAQLRDVWFTLSDSTMVRIEAQGEWRSLEQDVGQLENVHTGEILWKQTRQNSSPAGGASRNIQTSFTTTLPPGTYRTLFTTSKTHAYNAWTANPPLNPEHWGLKLFVDDAKAHKLDLWKDFFPLARLMPVGNDELRSAAFHLDVPTRVVVIAYGEGSAHKLYDYGWIVHQDTGTRVWEMTPEQTFHAGGSRKNRMTRVLLTLAPGTYTAYFKTDDSHAYNQWNSDPPIHPERWGLAILALTPPPSQKTPPSSATSNDSILIQRTQLGNDVHTTDTLYFQDTTLVHIHALGELLPSVRSDYGWIESMDSGETVWEMTRSNTRYAGGSYKNRLFDGQVKLPPGTYIVHFQTDDSHAYEAFQAEPPDNPEGWGIVIRKVSGTHGHTGATTTRSRTPARDTYR